MRRRPTLVLSSAQNWVREEANMFESLQEEIESTEGHTPIKEKLLRWVEIVVAATIVLGGLYYAIVALE